MIFPNLRLEHVLTLLKSNLIEMQNLSSKRFSQYFLQIVRIVSTFFDSIISLASKYLTAVLQFYDSKLLE